MSFFVRQADLETDRDLIVETLRRYLNSSYDNTRFEWCYEKNPYGRARTWIAEDAELHTTVGIASAFPRMFAVMGEVQLMWVLGDFCVSDQYRSLGPALQLQRACLTGIGSGKTTVSYDFPSLSMTAIYKRLGIPVVGQMVRLAKPLRVNRQVKKVVKIPVVAKGVSTVGNALLALRDHWPRSFGGTQISFLDGQCGTEFTVLAEQISSQYGICGWRSATYLNWRYLNNPLYPCQIMTAHVGGTLAAYVVMNQIGEDGLLVDIFGVKNRVVLRSLVNAAVTSLRQRGASTVSVILCDSHPWVSLFQGFGFQAREYRPIVIHAPSAPALCPNMKDWTMWFLTYGDRDS